MYLGEVFNPHHVKTIPPAGKNSMDLAEKVHEKLKIL